MQPGQKKMMKLKNIVGMQQYKQPINLHTFQQNIEWGKKLTQTHKRTTKAISSVKNIYTTCLNFFQFSVFLFCQSLNRKKNQFIHSILENLRVKECFILKTSLLKQQNIQTAFQAPNTVFRIVLIIIIIVNIVEN